MKIQEIPVDKIKIHQNIRSESKDVSDLMKSIEKDGLLHPIGVYPKGAEYILSYGSRRLRAVKNLNWKTVPCNIIPEGFDEMDFLSKQTVENIHRKDISPVELGRVCNELMTKGEMSMTEIAAKLHLPPGRVRKSYDVFKRVPKKYWDMIGFVARGEQNKGRIPLMVAHAILTLNCSHEEKEVLLKLAKTKELSTQQVHVIDKLIRSGVEIKDIWENLDKYIVKNITLAVNADEFERMIKDLEMSFTQYVREVIEGHQPPNKKLLIKK